MSLLLTVPPVAEPVSLAEAKAHLRITHPDDDAFITALVVASRLRLERQLNLRMVAQGWSQFLDVWPSCPAVALGTGPVSAISDVIVYGDTDAAASIDPAHYFLDQASSPQRLVFRQGRVPANPGRRAKGIEIRFTAGFGAPAAVPQDVKQAILLLVADGYANRGDDALRPLPWDVVQLVTAFRALRLS